MALNYKAWTVVALAFALGACTGPAGNDGGTADGPAADRVGTTDGSADSSTDVLPGTDARPDVRPDGPALPDAIVGPDDGPDAVVGPDDGPDAVVGPDAGPDTTIVPDVVVPDVVVPDVVVPDVVVPDVVIPDVVVTMDSGPDVVVGPDAGPDATTGTCSMTLQPGLTVGSMAMGTLMGAGTMAMQSCQATAPGAELYYPLTIATRAVVTLATVSTGDTIVSLRRNCTDGTSELSCGDDDPSGGLNSHTRTLLDPGTYYVVVDSFRATTTAQSFSLNVTSAPLAANSSCATATTLAPGSTMMNQDPAGAVTAPLCAGGSIGPPDAAVWYAVSVPASSTVTVTATPSSAMGVVELYSSSACATTTTCLSSARSGAGAAVSTTLSNSTAAPVTYYAMVGGNTTFSIAAAAAVTVPVNSTCGGTLPTLAAASPLTGQDTTAAPVAPSCDSSTRRGLWYNLSVPAGQRATVTATPTGTAMATTTLRIGGQNDCAATTCATAVSAAAAGAPAAATFDNPGTTALPFKVFVSAATAAQFTISTALTTLPPTAPNATCATAAPYSGASAVGDTSLGANRATGMTAPCVTGATGHSLYYSVSIPAGFTTAFTAVPTAGTSGAWDPVVRVLANCAATTCLTSADLNAGGGTETANYANPGTSPLSVIIEVQAYSATAAGPFTLTATSTPIPHGYTQSSIPSACVPTTGFAPAPGYTPGDDVTSTAITIPIPFQYYMSPVDRLVACSNGWLQLVAPAATPTTNDEYSNFALPSTAITNLVAPFFDDLDAQATGTVLSTGLATVGTTSVFVIDWTNSINHNGTSHTPGHFQVRLVPVSNVIEFHYCSLNPADPLWTGSSATIGLQNSTGTIATQVSYNTAVFTATAGSGNSLPTPTGFRFTPN